LDKADREQGRDCDRTAELGKMEAANEGIEKLTDDLEVIDSMFNENEETVQWIRQKMLADQRLVQKSVTDKVEVEQVKIDSKLQVEVVVIDRM
jgi:predicted  nucleic acid-binding Zn-ribbon protein